MNKFQEAVMRRYGFLYDPRNNPPAVDMPQAKPLYTGAVAGEDVVEEHGEWCLKRAMYPENVQRIGDLLNQHRMGM